jgi:hypothetical protein
MLKFIDKVRQQPKSFWGGGIFDVLMGTDVISRKVWVWMAISTRLMDIYVIFLIKKL